MEVRLKTPQGDTVIVTCRCGKCSLITSAQMQDFRRQAAKYGEKPLPDYMTVHCRED